MTTRSVTCLLALCAALLGGAVTLPVRAADAETVEKQVKSAMVFNFVQFIEWPATAFDKAEDPIIIGVVDAGALGDTLTATVEGKSVRGRKLVVQSFKSGAIGKCHVLVLGSLMGDERAAAMPAGPTGVLTIGDSEDFTRAGGMIRFYLEDRKVRFEINQAAAQRAQLQVSSKLLKIARVVNH